MTYNVFGGTLNPAQSNPKTVDVLGEICGNPQSLRQSSRQKFPNFGDIQTPYKLQPNVG